MHSEALRRIIETAFPVATVRNIVPRAPRVGTEADILYNLSPSATLGESATGAGTPRTCVHDLTSHLGRRSKSYDDKLMPSFSTGSLLGDCATYCTIGYDPSTPDKLPLPLMAPRLRPRRMCLDAVVFLPGFESQDLSRVVSANLLRHLPRLDGSDALMQKRPKKYHRDMDMTNPHAYEAHGLRILSDCIEIVIDPTLQGCRADVSGSNRESLRRTLYVGFANPTWSVTMLNRSLSEDERAPRRVSCGVSRETLRRALPQPVIDASRLLSNYSKMACVGTRWELPAMFWLNAALTCAATRSHNVDSTISDTVLTTLSGPTPQIPDRSQWEQDGYNRQVSWETLLSRTPMSSLTNPCHFELVNTREKNLFVAASLAHSTVRALSLGLMEQRAVLPAEHFKHPAFKAAIRHVMAVSQQSPPNFLAAANRAASL